MQVHQIPIMELRAYENEKPRRDVHDVHLVFVFLGLGHELVTFPHVHDVHDVHDVHSELLCALIVKEPDPIAA
jgi:hypothetical protein